MSQTEAPDRPGSPPPTSLRSGPLRGLTAGAVALVSLAAFEAVAVATALPTVAAALDGIASYPLAFALPLATAILGMVLSGVWSDAGGPAGPMRTGVALFVAGLGLAGLAPTMAVLSVGRAVQGLGSGLFTVALYVIVARLVPAGLRPRLFAALAAAWVLPSVLGPPLAGLIVQRLDWRWVFLVAAAMAVPAALLIEPSLRGLGRPARAGRDAADGGAPGGGAGSPATAGGGAQADVAVAEARHADVAAVEAHPDGPRAGQVGWAALAAGGALALSAIGVSGSRVGWIAAAAVGVTGLALVALAVPRLLPAGTWQARPGLPAVVALRGLIAAAFFGAEAFLPLLLSRERGLSPAAAGLVLTAAALSWATGSWVQGRDRAPSRILLLRAGTASIVVGVVAAAATVAPAVPVAVAVLGWALAGLGMGLVYPVLSVLTLELAAPGEQGAASAALQLADSLFAAVALALAAAMFAGLLAAGPVAYLAGFAVAAAPAAVALLVAGRVAPR